ncbi:MAG: hypothetical protein WEB19_01335 [Acidimicrobiia bacterium]
MADEKAPTDKALELFVYAPLGAAMYVRDMMPSMLGIFVARGKREISSHRKPEPPPVPSVPSATEVRQKMEDGFGLATGAAAGGIGLAKEVAVGGVGLARDVAGTALAGFMQMRSADSSASRRSAAPSSAPAASATTPPPAASNGEPAAAAPGVDSLPIPDYDELSASQVVERLVGLDHDSLDLIRRYETAHRARNTILGKIAQLG